MSTETPTQTIARRPYLTEEGTPGRRLEVQERLAEIQAAKDAAMDQFLPVMGSTITPQDFSQSMKDRDRDVWTAGKLRHVIAALQGRRCIITAEARTGFTLIGARLRGIRQTPGYGTYQILVEWEYAPGKTQGTWYPVGNIGPAIIGMDCPIRATELAMAESSAAITAAREFLPECTYGSWKVTPGPDYVTVRFAPQKADGGPETALFMYLTKDGFREGKKYNYEGCSKG